MLQKLVLLLYFVLSIANVCLGQCGKEDYKRCVMLADPLLREAELIYPDNLKDIEHVCRKWQEFVDCVKRYTDLCFTENKRKEFNKAVESPVDLVHQMCTSADYQQEYLKHAPCMRMILIDDSHCGRHYRYLVSQVSGEPATPALCCSHFRFRECLLDQTKRTCDRDAYPFAKQILDKAMGFLKDQCSSYKPDHIDCPGADFYSGSSNRITSRTEPTARVSQENSPPWSAEERRTTMKKYNWLTQTWTATSPESQSAENVESTRTGYSRGMSWDPSTDPVSWKVSGALQTESSWPLSSTQKITTVNNNMLVDEPNQQGLSNENTATSVSKIDKFLYIFVLIILALNNT